MNHKKYLGSLIIAVLILPGCGELPKEKTTEEVISVSVTKQCCQLKG